MTKADVIDSVCNKVGFSKKDSAEIVEMVFDTLKDTLERGEKIKLSGFGNFVVREKKSRVGRNPQTGQEIEISARRVLTFRPSQVLKNAHNKAEEEARSPVDGPRDGCYDAAPCRLPCRGVAQPGSALAWGASGRWFKSSRPDHWRPLISPEVPERSGASAFGEAAAGRKLAAKVRCFLSGTTAAGSRSRTIGKHRLSQ